MHPIYLSHYSIQISSIVKIGISRWNVQLRSRERWAGLSGGGFSRMTNTNAVILDLLNVPKLCVRYGNSKDLSVYPRIGLRDLKPGALGLVGSHLRIFPVWLTLRSWLLRMHLHDMKAQAMVLMRWELLTLCFSDSWQSSSLVTLTCPWGGEWITWEVNLHFRCIKSFR